MSTTTTSPNMLLPVPIPGADPSPQYAIDIDSCMTIIDQHTHSPGSGVQITPSGLNINADLPLNGNNLTLARTLRLQTQASTPSGASDLGCLYKNATDLFYIDGSGNNIQITQSGGIAGSPGSIANLTSPASASYVSLSSTFVWQSAANTAANMDAASYLLRNSSANSFALTLSPPNAMAANYSLVLPSLPSVQSIMTLDSSGNITAPWTVDNSSIYVNANQISVKPGGVTKTDLSTFTYSTQTLSVPVSNYSNSTTTPTTFKNPSNVTVSCTITTTGRPVMVMYAPDANNQVNGIALLQVVGVGATGQFTVFNGTTDIGSYSIAGTSTGYVSANSLNTIDFTVLGVPGTYTYTIQANLQGASAGWSVRASGGNIIAFELA